MDCREAAARADAFVDGELDPAERAAMAAHLLGCAACRGQVEERRELAAALSAGATYHRAPEGLAERIGAALDAAPAFAPGRAQRWRPAALAASLALVAALSSFATLRLAVPDPGDALLDDMVAGHVRALMADHLTDVASSDQHTVKPWFNGKLNLSPPVKDLTTSGFPLVGGRLDYVAGRPAAALVYRHRQHVINLFVAPDDARAAATPAASARQGYNVLHWSDGGLGYWAVSDLGAADLAQFQSLMRETR